MADEKITKVQLQIITKSLDKLFNKLGIDVEFSNHFLDRINDERNVKQITVAELVNIYHSLYDKYGVKLSKEPKDVEDLIKSVSTDINIPVALVHDKRTGKLDMVAKTIMRKKGFKSSSPVLAVEHEILSFKEYIAEHYVKEETNTEMGERLLADMEDEYYAMKKKHPIYTDSSVEAKDYKANLLKYFTKNYGKEYKKDIQKVLDTEIERLGGNIETGPKMLRWHTNLRILRSLVKLKIIKPDQKEITEQYLLNEMPNPAMISDRKIRVLNSLQKKTSPVDREALKKSITSLYAEYQPLLTKVRSKFEDLVRASLKGFHGVKFLADSKTLESVIDKTVFRGKQLSSINDLVRGAVLMQSKKDADNFVDTFLEHNKHIVVGYEEKLRGQDKMYGYFGSHHLDLNIDGIIVELQVMTSKLWDYKEEAHVIYNKSRMNPEGTDKFDQYRSKKIFNIANMNESVHDYEGHEITLMFETEELEEMDYDNWDVVL